MSDQPRPRAGAPVAFGAQVVPPLSGHASQVNSVVCGVVDGQPVAITGGGDGTVRVWDMACHQQIGLPLSNRRQPEMLSQSEDEDEVRGVAYGLLEGQPVAVSVAGTTITAWDLVIGRQVGETIESEPVRAWTPSDAPVLVAVACTEMNKRLIAVTGGFEVRMWDVAEGKQIGKPMFGHGGGWIVSVACGVLNGRPIAVTASEYGNVLVWDLLSQEQIGQPLPGNTSVAYGVLDGWPIVVCVNHGGRTLQAWDLHSRQPVGRPLTGHTSQVRAVALGATGGRLIAVGGDEETLRVWDVKSGRRWIGPPLLDGRARGWISSVACGTLFGRLVVLAASEDVVRVWDLEAHRRIGSKAPDRFANELPPTWTDPETGDVYDLTLPLVDDEGDPWVYVDYDGFEPIVSEPLVDPHCLFSIRDAHREYGFSRIVTSPQATEPRSARSGHMRSG